MSVLPTTLVLLLSTFLVAQPTSAPQSTSTARTLKRPDLELHYKDYGQGDPVLVITGGPGFSAQLMEPVAEMIAKKARAILPDPRGAGRSMTKTDEAITLEGTLLDFEALRQTLGLKQWTVLGCSWGGMLALEYAAKFPNSLNALILLDSGGPSWASFGRPFSDNITSRMTPDDRASRKYWSQKDVAAKDPQRATVEVLRAMLPAYFYDRTKSLPLIAGLKEGKEHYNPGAERLDEEFDKGEAERIEKLKQLKLRTLIIHGRQDPIPESVALSNQALLKGSQIVWLERCGHLPWFEQPEALEKALTNFLFPK